jgi:hypothetical protein
MTKKELSVEEQNRILSNRFGNVQNGAPPGGLPSDPYFLAMAEERAARRWGRWRTAAFVALFSLGCVTALFVGATLRRLELEFQLATARRVCERLPIALHAMETVITRGSPDSIEIMKRAAAASMILNMVLGPCIGDDNAPSFYAQRLSEAPDSAAVHAVVEEMTGRLR